MTRDNQLERDDLILYYSSVFMELAVVDAVNKQNAQIVLSGGIRLLVDRQTDGNRVFLKGKPNPFANMLIIPRK